MKGSRRTAFLIFVSGLVLGMGMYALISFAFTRGETEPPARGSLEASAEKSEVKQLEERVRRQEAEITRLQAELAQVPTVAEEPAAETEMPTEEVEAEDPRSWFARRLEERLNRRVDDMVARLGLTEEQREALKDVYQRQFEYFRARRRGEEVEPFNIDDAIAKVLTDDQFSDYLDSSQEEIYNRAELMATTQLVRLNQTVGLLPEQQDLVYDAIHYTAQEAMIARQTGEDFPMRETIRERLSTILTEEQMAAYQDSFRRGGFGGGGPPP